MKKQIVSFLVSLLLMGCVKNDKEINWIAVNTEILSSAVWRFSYYHYLGSSGDISYTDLPSCRQDDLLHFNKDGTGETNEGPTKCNSTDPQTQLVQWRFLTKDANTIELNGEEYYIDRLDGLEFKFHKKHLDPYAPEISYGYSR